MEASAANRDYMRKVLDFGSVSLEEYMGSDLKILKVARVSTGAGDDSKRDRGLMNYLLRNEHHSPFEAAVFRFHVHAPMFVARQWFRHRISSFSEASARYKEFEWCVHFPEEWRAPGTTNHQGSLEGLLDEDTQKNADLCLQIAYDTCRQSYDQMLKLGICKEQARLTMPMGMFTEWEWTVNLRSLMNFWLLRRDSHAQKEIREYADAVIGLVEATGDFDWVLEFFEKYHHVLQAVHDLLNKVKDMEKAAGMISALVEEAVA